MKNEKIDLEKFTNRLIELGVSIRAIPMETKSTIEVRNAKYFPDYKIEIKYLPEFKREMAIITKQVDKKIAGKFLLKIKCGTSGDVRFDTKKIYNSIEEIYNDVMNYKMEEK